MKKFCFLSLLFSLFSLFFLSCTLNQESGGSLHVTLPEETETTRAITPVETSYTVTIAGPTSVEPKTARAGETIQFSELASGNYSVKVEAFRKTKDSAPVKFAEGNENAVVEPEKETNVLIIMKAIKTDIDIDDFDEIDDAEKVDDTVNESNTEEKTEDKKDGADGTKTDAVETGKDQETKTEVEKDPEPTPEPATGLFVKLAGIEGVFMDENNKPYILPNYQGEQKNLLCVKYDGTEVEKDKFNIEVKEGAWANLGTLKLMVLYAPTNESTEFEITVKKILKPTSFSLNTLNITRESGASYDFQLMTDSCNISPTNIPVILTEYLKAKMIVRVFEPGAEESGKGKVCLNEKEFTEFEFNRGRVDGVLSYDDITLDSDNKRVITTPGNYDLSVTVYQYISNADYEKYFIPGFFEAKESISIGE